MRKINLPIIALICFISMVKIACPLFIKTAYPWESLHHSKNTHIANDNEQKQNIAVEDEKYSFTNTNFIKQVQFSGQYYSKQNNKLFDYLENKQGLLQSMIFQNEQWSQQPTQDWNAIALQLFDPVYHDRDFVLLILHIANRTSDNTWAGINSQAIYMPYWKGSKQDEKNITANYTMVVKNIQSSSIQDVRIVISVQGANFQFTTELAYDNQANTIIAYCLYTTFIIAVQIFFLWRTIVRIDGDAPHLAFKISLTTIAICNIMDFYMTIIHIQYIIASFSSYYMMYLLPALAYSILFIVYDMKLLFIVWRSHTMRQIENPQELRKSLTIFYVKFYFGLFIYLALIYFFSFDQWFIIAQNLIMIPQIVRNVRNGNSPGFEPQFIFGYLLIRFFIPFYERLCPDNHFLLMPMVVVVISIAILNIIQVVILYLQNKLGSRFFIPRLFQPDFFEYQAKITYNEQTKEMDCSICLMNFFGPNPNSNNIQSFESSLSQPMLQQQNVMKTPCNHYFHRDCLISWADIKLECPSCRAPLPPL